MNANRPLFMVSRSYNGWRVSDESRSRDWCRELSDAVASANALAQARQARSGVPAQVFIEAGRLRGIGEAKGGSGFHHGFFTRN